MLPAPIAGTYLRADGFPSGYTKHTAGSSLRGAVCPRDEFSVVQRRPRTNKCATARFLRADVDKHDVPDRPLSICRRATLYPEANIFMLRI